MSNNVTAVSEEQPIAVGTKVLLKRFTYNFYEINDDRKVFGTISQIKKVNQFRFKYEYIVTLDEYVKIPISHYCFNRHFLDDVFMAPIFNVVAISTQMEVMQDNMYVVLDCGWLREGVKILFECEAMDVYKNWVKTNKIKKTDVERDCGSIIRDGKVIKQIPYDELRL